MRPVHAHHVLVHHKILLRHPGISIRIRIRVDSDWHGRVVRCHWESRGRHADEASLWRRLVEQSKNGIIGSWWIRLWLRR